MEIDNLDDSITQLKEVASHDKDPPECSSNENTKNLIVCTESYNIKPNSKKQYAMTRCALCMVWFQDTCVGIGKDEPIGLWMCHTCRVIPKIVKDEVISLKNDVEQLKESTDTILSAVNGLSSQLENCVSSLQDQISALSKQIKSRDKTLSASVDALTSVTNKIQSSLEDNSSKILNKTNTIIEKVKSQTVAVEKVMNNTKVSIQNGCTENQSNATANADSAKLDKTLVSDTANVDEITKPKQTSKPKYRNVSPDSQARSKTEPRSSLGLNTNSNHLDENETIDLTNDTKKQIDQSTLLVGSSILKGIKNNDLKPNTTVRSFSGARTDTIDESLSKYDITSCKTIILHVGGNDADKGVDLSTFSKNYVSLLTKLASENLRIIVSGLLPRESVDLKQPNP